MHKTSQIRTESRASMSIKPRTRDRLNKFVADQRLAHGKFISHNDAVDMLLDHYAATAAQQPAERVRELA